MKSSKSSLKTHGASTKASTTKLGKHLKQNSDTMRTLKMKSSVSLTNRLTSKSNHRQGTADTIRESDLTLCNPSGLNQESNVVFDSNKDIISINTFTNTLKPKTITASMIENSNSPSSKSFSVNSVYWLNISTMMTRNLQNHFCKE